ncbi:dihydrofolate reductase [Parapedobacter luteus]|uniref:Dihydrofolate reductase n=1 Tax=Parapedobacter luteus TaxID=623280 RepID=A0A1T5ATS1_9SPHI|nr:dihydrofolate reductase family protein [Parapedobacter luteus]SKB38199.1 dihydrofolate reductase [Parapedobacter luteus]
MGKLIAAINMTLDGFCDHTAMIADDELHQHYNDLLRGAGVVLYGRITYRLMEYWLTVVENPTGNNAMDEFAAIIDGTPKFVFSHTLENVEWKSATVAKRSLEEEVLALKQQSDKDVLVGSPSLIVAAMNLGLVDEYQFCVHPVVVGTGLQLFKNISDRVVLKLIKTKSFGSGTIALYYEPIKNDG